MLCGDLGPDCTITSEYDGCLIATRVGYLPFAHDGFFKSYKSKNGRNQEKCCGE
jgi:hypothetical protein